MLLGLDWSDVDLKHPVAIIGIVCFLAAIVGGGLKAAGTEVPVINTVHRQLLLAAAGIAVIVLVAVVDESVDPRVGSVAIEWDTHEVSRCPQVVGSTGIIELKGAGALLRYRLIVGGRPGAVSEFKAESASSYPFTWNHDIDTAPSEPLGLTIQLEVMSPSHALSDVDTMLISCVL